MSILSLILIQVYAKGTKNAHQLQNKQKKKLTFGLFFRYAFVAMEQYQEAQMAVQGLNATPFHGRQLQVRFKT